MSLSGVCDLCEMDAATVRPITVVLRTGVVWPVLICYGCADAIEAEYFALCAPEVPDDQEGIPHA